MKSPEEIKSAHDMLCALVSGHWPIHFTRGDLRILEAQYHVLCYVLECDGADCFKNSIDSLKDLMGQIRFVEHGRKFKSRVLVE